MLETNIGSYNDNHLAPIKTEEKRLIFKIFQNFPLSYVSYSKVMLLISKNLRATLKKSKVKHIIILLVKL